MTLRFLAGQRAWIANTHGGRAALLTIAQPHRRRPKWAAGWDAALLGQSAYRGKRHGQYA